MRTGHPERGYGLLGVGPVGTPNNGLLRARFSKPSLEKPSQMGLPPPPRETHVLGDLREERPIWHLQSWANVSPVPPQEPGCWVPGSLSSACTLCLSAGPHTLPPRQ